MKKRLKGIFSSTLTKGTLLALACFACANRASAAPSSNTELNLRSDIAVRNHDLYAEAVLYNTSRYHGAFWLTPLYQAFKPSDKALKSWGFQTAFLVGEKNAKIGIHGGGLISDPDASLDVHFGPTLYLGADELFCTVTVDIARHFDKEKTSDWVALSPAGWSQLYQLSAGYKIYLSKDKSCVLTPSGSASYIAVQQKLSAGSTPGLDKLTYAYFTPKGILKLHKAFRFKAGSIIPAIYLGWIRYMPLKSTNEAFSKEKLDQLIAGGELELATAKSFSLTLKGEAQVGKKMPVYRGFANLAWRW